jgi:hypothetical protein
MAETRNPDGSFRPFVRLSKDMKQVEIVVCGLLQPIFVKKVGKSDPSTVLENVRHYARTFYRFEGV